MSKKIEMVVMALAVMLSVVSMAQRPGGGLLNRRNNRQGGNGAAAANTQPSMTREDLKNVPRGTNGVPALAFNQAPVELVLDAYAAEKGLTIIPAPDLPKATITLRSLEGQTLSKDEYLEAIEVTLTMNGVVLEPRGEKFLRALPRKTVRTHGIPLLMGDKGQLPEQGRVVSQMIVFKNIEVTEAQKALEGFKAPEGLFQVFERTNAILVTDTQENINRMLEIVKAIDVATPVMEDVFVRQIEYAVAGEIKTLLETIVTESQKENEQKKSGPKSSGAPGFGSSQPNNSRSSLLNLNKRPGVETQVSTANADLVAAISDADRGMIRGKVLIVSDERSNKLIIITNKSNMDFFDRVIQTLDVETTPEVQIDVIRLKYAEAEDVEQMLNDLIGASSSGGSNKDKNAPQNKPVQGGSQNLTRGTTSKSNSSPSFKNSDASKLGELNKDNVKVLADKRINGIVVMARKSDMRAIREVIENMDVKLSQVLLETVILQIELGDDLKTGIDWVQQGKALEVGTGTYSQKLTGYTAITDDDYEMDDDGNSVLKTGINAITGQDGTLYKPVYDWVENTKMSHGGFVNNGNYMLGGGGGSASSTLQTMMNVGTNVTDAIWGGANPIGGGINYFLKSDKLNIAAVIQATKDDSRSKVLASPILMTVDNKEATIEATDMIYLFSGYQYSGSSMYGSQVRNYEKRDIGLTVKVTPKINPNGTVMLTIEETIETQGSDQAVPNESGGTDKYATVTTRKLNSDVSVENRQTIVMGGLTKKTNVDSESGIPVLKDIPWVGKWLFGSVTHKESRSELLVFITPYVLDDAEAAQAEALRRKKALSDARAWEDNGWSTSPLADPVSKKEQLRKFQDEWEKQDEERRAKLAIEKAKIDRAKELKKLTEKEREFWLELHKEDLEKDKQEELEKKMKDKESQEELKALVEKIKKDKGADAEKELKAAEEIIKSQTESEKWKQTDEAKREAELSKKLQEEDAARSSSRKQTK